MALRDNTNVAGNYRFAKTNEQYLHNQNSWCYCRLAVAQYVTELDLHDGIQKLS